jgi:hypothetical protein
MEVLMSRSETTGRTLRTGAGILAAAAALLFVTARPAQASGGGIQTGASPQSSTSTVSLKIPGIVGIDVETDIGFDLTLLSAASSPTICANVFPAGSSCATATYTATSANTAGLSPAPAAGAAYISIIDTNAASVGTKNMKHSIAAAWSGTTPGIPTTNVQTKLAASNNGGVGTASFAALPTAATAMTGNASIVNTGFNWTRQDQAFQLVIQSTDVVSATTDATAVVTYTFSRT